MSGYAQQDAHEFSIVALNQIHSTCHGSTNISCNCIVHQTFAGQLHSEVTCERCRNVTRTVDPMSDISLELRDPGMEREITLAGCLSRYYSCTKCAVGRLGIRKLPPVLSFQFKARLHIQHETVSKGAPQKIDTPVRFPAAINMVPYTTLAVPNSDETIWRWPCFFSPSGFPDSGPTHPGPDAMYEYHLFAVINHEGHIENGRYTNFARFQDNSLRYNDPFNLLHTI
ncbi:hypothetical protein EDD17DRAFT_1574345 [Pisolithus thermaeus]|nr:hypothetical protein EDD17DRAFT_1574345 [Pisolithus thermaeus]